MVKDILKEAQEEALYNILGKALNSYIEKNSLPAYRILRVLMNMQIQIISKAEDNLDV